PRAPRRSRPRARRRWGGSPLPHIPLPNRNTREIHTLRGVVIHTEGWLSIHSPHWADEARRFTRQTGNIQTWARFSDSSASSLWDWSRGSSPALSFPAVRT